MHPNVSAPGPCSVTNSAVAYSNFICCKEPHAAQTLYEVKCEHCPGTVHLYFNNCCNSSQYFHVLVYVIMQCTQRCGGSGLGSRLSS